MFEFQRVLHGLDSMARGCLEVAGFRHNIIREFLERRLILREVFFRVPHALHP